MNYFSKTGTESQTSGRSFAAAYKVMGRNLIALTILCSGLVLIDRLVFSSFFHKVLPTHWPMKTNAALSFLLSGIALWIRQTHPSGSRMGKLAGYLGVFIFGLAAVTLCEYVCSVDLGTARFLFKLFRTIDYYPVYDRMAPLAAINFLFLGIILYLYEVENPKVILLVQVLTLFLFFGSLVGLFSHAYVLPNWFGPNPNFLSIALFAAVLFTFLAVSVLFSRPDKGLMVVFSDEGIGGSLARWLTVFSILIPSILDLMTMRGEEAGFFDFHSKSVIDVSAIILVFTIVVYQASNWVFRLDGQRMKAEEDLKETLQGLARAQEIAHLGSWKLDLLRNKLTWSDEVYRIFGLKPQEFTATYEAFLERIHPDDRSAVDAAFQGSIREGRDSYEIGHRIVRNDTGEIRWVQEKCCHERDRNGKVILSTGMVLDVSERRKAEEEVKETLHELERSNADLEQFAYVASHDLQEPLRMIGSYVQLLQRRYKGKLDSDADDFIEYAVNGAKRMRNLINDLLTYSRVMKGKKEFEATSFEEVLKLVERDLELALQASGGAVTHEPLPTIKADPAQMAQVFQNLIGNALKFRGDQPPKIQIEAKRGKTEWVFSVRDNGIGFEPQYCDRIFVIFQRLQGGEKFPGTGIGLAICKKILERHGGRIWAESVPGEGSVFRFTIPIM